tara:strand:- start:74 stop:355 length:282 start_codon:yes stop_codon:yes gene_type:complete
MKKSMKHTKSVLDALEQALYDRASRPRPSTGSARPRCSTRRGPRRIEQALELATLKWVARFNRNRLIEPLSCIPPAEFEANYHRQRAGQAATA